MIWHAILHFADDCISVLLKYKPFTPLTALSSVFASNWKLENLARLLSLKFCEITWMFILLSSKISWIHLNWEIKPALSQLWHLVSPFLRDSRSRNRLNTSSLSLAWQAQTLLGGFSVLWQQLSVWEEVWFFCHICMSLKCFTQIMFSSLDKYALCPLSRCL